MDLLTKNLMDINRAFKKFNFGQGDMKPEVVNATIAMLKEAHAIVRTTIQVEAMRKKGTSVPDVLERKNYYSPTTAIDIDGDPEADKVKCPEQEELITRAECLEYSGKSENYEYCKGCEIGRATKEILLPPKE